MRSSLAPAIGDIAGATFGARAAGAVEGDDDVIAGLEADDAFADFFYDPGAFVTEDEGRN
jgi:hypothetical protein